MKIESLARLSNRELVERVQGLLHDERRATAALVVHLAEIERRKLYLDESCRSLFTYCTQVLHLSEQAAYNRIEAARAATRFPAVLRALERGDVHLTAVKLLAAVFTDANHEALLAAAKHESRREVEELVAGARPQPDAPSKVRKQASRATRSATVPPASAGRGQDAGSERANTGSSGANAGSKGADTGSKGVNAPAVDPTNPATPAVDPGPFILETPASPRSTVVPIAPDRYKIQFTASAETHAKLRRAQELLRHRIPNGDLSQVFDQALDRLVRDLEKKKFAAKDRPGREVGREAAGSPRAVGQGQPRKPVVGRASRHIPAAVKRAVWQRDGGRCSFVSRAGLRCSERGQLEFDHVQPFGDGGSATIANVRLLCRTHNQHEAKRYFGVWSADGIDSAHGFGNSSWNESG